MTRNKASPKQAFAALKALEKTGSRLDKEAILNDNKGNKVLRELFRRAYNGDKYHTYPDASCAPRKLLGNATTRYKGFVSILDKLAKREVTGNKAFTLLCVFLRGCTATENKWYGRVLHHDMKTGVGTRTLVKTWPGLFATEGPFNGCMLAAKWDPNAYEEPYHLWGEPKLDGLRCVVVLAKGVPTLFTRSGKSIDHLSHITKALTSLKLKNKVLDGEMCVFNDEGQTDWKLTLSLAKPRVHITEEEAVEIRNRVQYHMFDMVTRKEYDNGVSNRPLWKRVKALRDVVSAQGKFEGWCDVITTNATKHPAPYYGPLRCVTRKRVTTEADILAYYDRCTTRGYEGIIVKDPDGLYWCGKRSSAWLKIKPTEDKSGVVRGFEKGRGRHATLSPGQRQEAHAWLAKLGEVAKTATGYRVKPTKKVKEDTVKHRAKKLRPSLKQRMTYRAKNGRIVRVEIRVRARLGALLVDSEDGDRVRVGGKMSDKLREDFWDNRAEYLDQWLDYSQQKDAGDVGATRFPQFERWRVQGDKA